LWRGTLLAGYKIAVEFGEKGVYSSCALPWQFEKNYIVAGCCQENDVRGESWRLLVVSPDQEMSMTHVKSLGFKCYGYIKGL